MITFMFSLFQGGGWVHSVSFSADGNKLAWVGHDSSISVADATRDMATHKLKTQVCCDFYNFFFRYPKIKFVLIDCLFVFSFCHCCHAFGFLPTPLLLEGMDVFHSCSILMELDKFLLSTNWKRYVLKLKFTLFP